VPFAKQVIRKYLIYFHIAQLTFTRHEMSFKAAFFKGSWLSSSRALPPIRRPPIALAPALIRMPRIGRLEVIRVHAKARQQFIEVGAAALGEARGFCDVVNGPRQEFLAGAVLAGQQRQLRLERYAVPAITTGSRAAPGRRTSCRHP
jgi:hypothetical protein